VSPLIENESGEIREPPGIKSIRTTHWKFHLSRCSDLGLLGERHVDLCVVEPHVLSKVGSMAYRVLDNRENLISVSIDPRRTDATDAK